MNTLKRTTMTERAAEEIKKYLISGQVKPGDKLLTETEFADQLGVGRSTVREAIRTLQAMGYVELRPGRGAFAVITSPDDEFSMRENAIRYFKGNQGSLNDFLEVWNLIEPYAASLAATRANHEALEVMQTILGPLCGCCRLSARPSQACPAGAGISLYHCCRVGQQAIG